MILTGYTIISEDNTYTHTTKSTSLVCHPYIFLCLLGQARPVADLGFHEGGFIRLGEIFLQTMPTFCQKPRPLHS